MTRNAFPRSARLLSGKQYGLVFGRNTRLSDKYWTLLAHRQHGKARLGLAIAKKRARRAVDRNRLKRVAREAFRQQQLQLDGLDLVIMNRDAAAVASARQLRIALDKLLHKASRIQT